MVKCPEGKIVNPKTGRCVKRDGVLGKKLLTPTRKATAKKTKTPTAKKTKTPTRKATAKKAKTPNRKATEKKAKTPTAKKTKTPTRKATEKKAKTPTAKKAKTPKSAMPTTPKRKNSGHYNIKEGVMKYKELRPREIENKPSMLDKYSNYYVSEKYDGWQAVWDGSDKFTTNTGKRTFKPPKEWSSLLPQDISIAGELIIEGKQATDVATLTTSKGDWKKVKFMAFDIPGMKEESFRVRTNELKRIVKEQCRQFSNCPMIYVDQKIYKTGKEIYNRWKDVLKKGGEGLVLTDPDSKYRPMKRSNDRVKLKGREDTEGVIQSFNVTDGKLRSIVLKLDNGNVFNLGIGFSNKERNEYSKIFKKGDKVKFSYRSMSSGGKPKEARFVGKRHVADLL